MIRNNLLSELIYLYANDFYYNKAWIDVKDFIITKAIFDS